ncbi:MAG: hypothetical protein L6R41_000586 [Letrouitia leprolyta]|nr:MAG: hypothetical protein L6R41_000586 [Letrouitia leprolyta]
MDICVNMDKVELKLVYRLDLIREKYAECIASNFETVIRNVLLNPTIPIDQIDIPSPRDKQQIVLWNPPDPFQAEQQACMHQLVAASVQKMPQSQAVCGWDGDLTYAELDSLSNFAAAELARKGVKPGTFVPFAYEKSIYAVVAMLGILKAGGALVPINAKDPKARILEMVSSTGAEIVATTEELASIFKSSVPRICIISQKSMKTLPKLDVELLTTKPSDPMLVLFTSGSTGRPKGMIHTHSSMATHAITHGSIMAYRNARVLQFAAYTFDVAIFDIFTTLIFGGCICVPSEADRTSNIVNVITSMRVDHAILTPSFAGLINPSEVPTLKFLAVGGEALPQDRIETWAEKVQLMQIYGPAEAGICLATDMDPRTPGAVIGFPLRNSSCWLVDPDDISRLVPIGAVGELVIAGPSLALGYLNDRARTTLAFIDAPGWAMDLGLPFQRFYRSGDLLRYNMDAFDGSFIFVGRKDSQIKLRGQRIEPGEVEYHLGMISEVAHATVTMPVRGQYAGHLVAVVQTRVDKGNFQTHSSSQMPISEQPKLSLSVVREVLSKSLPSYMIPSVYLEVDAIPCVASMKIDRRLVQTWLNSSTCEHSSPMLSQYPIITEEGTARCLSRALLALVEQKHSGPRCDDITPRDFIVQDMGIDSIQVISLAMLIKKTYGVKIPTSKLLDPSTTIRHLADWVDSHTKQDHNGYKSHANGARKPFDLVHEVGSLCDELKTSVLQDSLGAIPLKRNNSHTQIRNVFLTGATGFLGIVILHNLLKRNQETNIYALVRCPSEQAGLLRLLQVLDSRGHWKPAYFSRLYVIPGNLNDTNLDISISNSSKLQFMPQNSGHPPAAYATNIVNIDTIIHAGARVHYSTSYHTLKQTNSRSVLSLLLSFTRVASIKRFIYISGGEHPSSLSLLSNPDYVRAIEEEANGYTQSKVVSEQLIQFAASTLYPDSHDKSIRIIKPGYIIGDAKDGIANQSDFLWRLIKGCVEIGAYDISAVRKWLFVADVEFLAEVVIQGLERSGKDDSKIKNAERSATAYSAGWARESTDYMERVLCGVWFEDIWAILKEDFGFKLKGMETDAWMDRLTKAVQDGGEKHLLFPLLDTLEREGKTIGVEWPQTGTDNGRGRALASFRRNVEHLIGVGFLSTSEES